MHVQIIAKKSDKQKVIDALGKNKAKMAGDPAPYQEDKLTFTFEIKGKAQLERDLEHLDDFTIEKIGERGCNSY